MSSQRTTLQQQQVEELCAAAIRALSGDPEMHFRGGRLHRREELFGATAPHLAPSPDDDFGSFRGAADGLALRLSHSDAGLHQRLSPDGDVARLVFEMLEQFRVESLAPPTMVGMRRNLRHRHETWSRAFHASGLTESPQGLLLYTVAQICRSRVTREPVVEETEDHLEGTRFSLSASIGHDLLALGRTRSDQTAYARHARAIADKVTGMFDDEETSGSPRAALDRHKGFFLWQDSTASQDPSNSTVSGHRRLLSDAELTYGVFTRAYDREQRAGKLVRPELLKEYRALLDDRVRRQGVNVQRLAGQLTSLFAEPSNDGWEGAQESGVIDGRSLAQLITSPTERRLFRTERREPTADCIVTFLIDCSGSMRQHHESIAMIVDVFARALDLAGISSEILGFTTGAYNGGRAFRDWQRSGRPAQPGRLNELSHLVFKDADTPWRLARPEIAGLLKEDIYREGVDGEAVLWACDRLRSRPEQTRVLVVFSDGSPMDSATTLTNGPDYLDHHLQAVVSDEGRSGNTRVYGVGLGLDLTRYYPNTHALDLADGCSNEVFRAILDMLARPPRH